MQAIIATEPGEKGRPNEDWAGATPQVLVLLDGLSSATDVESPCRHGTPWFVRNLGAQLLVSATDLSRSLPDALALAIETTARLHESCDVNHPDSPSATVATFRLDEIGNVADYLVLGDSVVVLDTADGIRIITDDRVDRVANAEKSAVYGELIGTDCHRQAVDELIATQKPLRNHPDGYWVAAGDPAVAVQALTGNLPSNTIASATILSDGASRIVDTFQQLTWPAALDVLGGMGPGALIRRVRQIEVTDAGGRRWPRYKESDDATIVWEEFGPTERGHRLIFGHE